MAGIGYAFISAYLKGEEARTVTSEHLGAVTRATSYQDIIDSIRSTDIGSCLEGRDINSFNELDDYLWIYFSGCLNRISQFKSVPTPAERIIRAYITRYDILNIKTALQNIITGNRVSGIPVGNIYRGGYLDRLMDAGQFEDIISVLNACGLGQYTNVLEKYRIEEGVKKEVLIDTGLEAVYFRELMNEARHSRDGGVLLRAFQTILDMTNLQIVLRAVVSESRTDASGHTIEGGCYISDSLIRELLTIKIQDIPGRLANPEIRSAAEEILAGYEKSSNISVIDETIDRYRFRILRGILAPKIMSPAVVVWYLVIKEIELRNLRLILKVVLDNIPPDEITDYLVFPS